MSKHQEIKKILDQKVKQYNKIEFIEKDPICIPHQFKKQQDIEIAAFLRPFLPGEIELPLSIRAMN